MLNGIDAGAWEPEIHTIVWFPRRRVGTRINSYHRLVPTPARGNQNILKLYEHNQY